MALLCLCPSLCVYIAFPTKITVLLSKSWNETQEEDRREGGRMSWAYDETVRHWLWQDQRTHTAHPCFKNISIDHQSTIKSWFHSSTEKFFYEAEQHTVFILACWFVFVNILFVCWFLFWVCVCVCTSTPTSMCVLSYQYLCLRVRVFVCEES